MFREILSWIRLSTIGLRCVWITVKLPNVNVKLCVRVESEMSSVSLSHVTHGYLQMYSPALLGHDLTQRLSCFLVTHFPRKIASVAKLHSGTGSEFIHCSFLVRKSPVCASATQVHTGTHKGPICVCWPVQGLASHLRFLLMYLPRAYVWARLVSSSSW